MWKRSTLTALAIGLAACGCSPTKPTQAGGKPVSHWVQELKNPDAKVRRHAIAKLGNVGPKDASALPAVRDSLADADAGVRAEAIQAVMKFGAAAKEAESQLVALEKSDPSAQVRQYAGKALARLRME